MVQLDFLYYLHIMTCVITTYVLYVAIREKPSKTQTDFVLAMLSIVCICVSSFLQSSAQTDQSVLLGAKMSYFANTASLMCIPRFIYGFCGYQEKKGMMRFRLWGAIFFLVIILSFDYTHIFLRNYYIVREGGLQLFVAEKGYLYYLYLIYAFYVFGSMNYILFKKFVNAKEKDERTKLFMCLCGCLLPMFSTISKQVNQLRGIDAMPFALCITCIIYAVMIQKYHLFDLKQNAKEVVLEHSKEAAIVVGAANEILFFNELAKSVYPNLILYENLADEIWDVYQEKDNVVFIAGHYYATKKTELYREDGVLEGHLLEAQDITKYQETSNEMKRLVQEANLANKAKNAFLATMSHDIRTPVNVVLGMDEMIMRESSQDEIVEYAQNIQSASETLLTLMNDIMDFSKIETGKMEIVPVPYELREIIQNTTQMVLPRIKDKPIAFSVEVDNNVPSKLFGDKNRVQQVVTNILTNAAKYTDSGNVWMNVSANPMKEAMDGANNYSQLVFSVRDTGKGIKEEDLDKLFESFSRVDEEKNRNIEGTGLGLAITKKLVEQMQGEITVNSTYGVGSEFTIYLPQIVIDGTSYHESEERKEQRNVRVSYKSRFIAPDAKVLVVDDNKVNRKVFCNLLKETRIQITECESGMECLARVKEQQYDVIFMDHFMPEMDGIETLVQLMKMKDENKSMDAKIIALTANVVSGAKEMYMESGFSDYLPKPINPDALEEMLIKHLPKQYVIVQ